MTLNKISKAFFINLDRRIDRLEHVNKSLPFSAERFPAIDAKNLELNEEIKKIFGKNLQKFTKAEIACSLSHYKLWKNLTLDRDADNYLILEDDAVFKEGFTNFWNQVFSKHIPENYNLIYLGGCQPWNKPHYHKALEKYNNYFFNIKRNDFFTKNDHFWHMNASSYILSKTAASLLCQWVEQNGIDYALDNFMQRFFNENKLFAAPKSIYHLNPLMSYQLHEENDNTEIDKKSDLRFADEKFGSVDLKNKPIPKKIFQTWENDKLEGVFKYLTDRVKSYNRSYSYEFFDGEKRRNFIKDNFAQDVLECYDLIIPGAFKADLWRYCVLYKYGGIYCDIDMLCFSCFDKVIIGDEIDFFAPIDINPREDICSHAVSNAFIGSSPGHPIIKICIDLIVQNVISERWLNEGMIDLDFSGPGLLGRAINLFLGRSEKSKLKGCEGIIKKGLHKIKLIYFKQGLEYMTDLGGDIIFQNKNGNQSIKRLIIQQEKDSNVRPWVECMIGGKLPYIKKDNTNDISLINPTAITYLGKQYTLYRGEKYLDEKPPPLGFNRSDFSYWLEVDGVRRQCIFNFDNYAYKTIRRIDIDSGSNKSIVEDLRFIESSVKQTSEGLICLATCCLLPYTRIFQGTKNEDGSWNKSRGLGLEFTFRAAYCQVNLSTAEIKFIDQIDGSSQIQNEKNWSCFINNGEYYVVYSMFPLVYTKASSLADISFSSQDLSQELIYSSSTNPIKIGENQYAMLCHKRDKDKEFCYNYQLVTFEIKNGSICNIQCLPVNIDEGYYCSSIMKEGLKIKVFAGVRDLSNKCFNIDIPKIHINQFPNLQTISSNQIPKKIHLSWKNKNVLDSNYSLIKKGAKNLELLNPGWDIQVYDDEDINRLLRDSIGRDNWNLIKDRKITEKTDLWRLLKTYKEGGLYIDIDRYIDIPLSEIINHKTSCVLPTFQDIDFSQDFILTCAKNPIIGRAIANNLNYRKQGKPLFFLAVYSYMQSACEVLGEKVVDRGNNTEYFNSIRNKINQCEYLETYREIGPEHHVLFRNINSDFSMQQFEQDKADFYNGYNVIHWNNDTRKKHELISLQPRQELDIKEYYKKLDQKFIFEGGENSIENKGQAKKLIELCNKYNCKNVMEIGFNAGHSADLFLSINENIKLTSFDIGLHKYVNYGKKFIDNKYPNRHSLILGDSKKTIPDFYKYNSSAKFDLIFIDGDHSEIGAISDLLNCKKLSHSQTIVVMDDTRNEQPMASWNINVNKAWQKCISAGIVYQIESEDYNQEGFCARGQSWGRYILKEEKENNTNLEIKQQQFKKFKDQWQKFKDYDFLKYISRRLPNPEIPGDKFSKYNPGQKIAIVSLYTSEISDYAVYSEMSVRDYCLKQGYTFYVYRETLEKNASANWSKAKAILNHIDDHDYIVWMDSDTLIFNPEKKLESIIEKAPKKFILATKDIGDNCMLNSGVLFLKSHQYTKNLITKWRGFNGDKSSLYASGGDQEILCEILRKSDSFGFNRKIFEMNEFNTDPRLVNEDTFILHFMAYPHELKKIFMSYWCS